MTQSSFVTPYKMPGCTCDYPATSKAALLRLKLDNGKRLTPDEKVWVSEKCHLAFGCRNGIPILGWMIPFSDVLKLFWYETNFGIYKAYACDKTTLRKIVHHKIYRIVDIEKYNEIA